MKIERIEVYPLAATLHVTATLPPNPPNVIPQPYEQAPVVEFDCTPHPVRDALTEPRFEPLDSILQVPTGPGLGVTVLPAVLERFRVAPALVVEEPATGLAHAR